MAYYYIRAGTPIWRRQLQDMTWVPLTSTKSVIYTEKDVLMNPKGLSDGMWTFRLPQSALPYVSICVEKKDVDLLRPELLGS